MKKIFTLLVFASVAAFSQVTLRVTSLPSNTPAAASVYLAGTPNDWNPASEDYILQPDGLGNRTITIPEGTGTAEFKFTRGGWPTVEGNATGGFLPNRTFTFTGAPQTISLTIQSWEDLGGTTGSTAASNVQILSTSFEIPQLGRTRRIWLYLPPDYSSSSKNYPVLYMEDGQNLFDANTSFAGEWQVDETLNTLFNAGDYGALVVGIDNGGGDRLNEYSPWVNSEYGGGQGDEYMAFLANTLKPYIDANYRTRPEAAYNALIGSSMGAIISTYGVCEYPSVFKKCGSLSPAYWFAFTDMENYISTVSGLNDTRIYFVSGTNESSSMVSDMSAIRIDLQARGLTTSNTNFQTDSAGTHSETWWRTKFGPLYQWLFADETLSVTSPVKSSPKIIQTPSGILLAEGFERPMIFKIVNGLGQITGTVEIFNGRSELPDNLSAGIYILQIDGAALEPVRVRKW